MSIRYVDPKGTIQEKFIQFIECDTGTSADAFAEKLKTANSDLGLHLSKVRGHGYDGASNMSRKNAPVAKLILK